MKKTQFTIWFIALLFLANYQITHAQLRYWSLLPNKADMTPTTNNPPSAPILSDISPTQTSYNYYHNIIYDPNLPNDNMIFYISDGLIYDLDGGQIDNFTLLPAQYHHNEVSIIPIESDEEYPEYMVITPLEYKHIGICTDFDEKTVLSINGGIITEDIGGFRGIVNDDFQSHLIATSTELIIDENEGPVRIVFTCNMSYSSQNGFSLFLNIYKVKGVQMTHLKTFNKTDLNVSNDALLRGTSDLALNICNTTTEMELIDITENNTEKFRLAFSYNEKNSNPPPDLKDDFVIHIIEFDKSDFSDINNLTWYNNKIYRPRTTGVLDNPYILHGLEFSPNGENLFFTYTNSCDPFDPKTFLPGFRYMNLGVYLPLNTPMAYDINPPSASLYSISSSFLEIGYDDKLYAISKDQSNNLLLHHLSNPNSPNINGWGYYQYNNITYPHSISCGECDNLSSYLFPDQIDGENYETINNYEVCCAGVDQNTGENITIETGTSVTWTENKYMHGDIIIEENASLVINGIVHMPVDAKIIIEAKGELIIDGGYISNFCDEFWQGIIVRGNRNASQTPYYQGLLLLQDATIENARIGVQLSDQWDKHGGLIYAINSTFRNCRKGLEFMSYTYEESKSYFNECTFECTGPLNDPLYAGAGTSHFATLWQIDGVKFMGNIFRNTASYNEFPSGERGTGIGSLEAGYDIMKSDNPLNIFEPCDHPDGLPNRFYDLDVGVYNGNNYNNYRIKIRENEFINCNIAIQNDNDFDLLVYHNILNYGADPSYYVHEIPAYISLFNPIGISTSNSQQLNILENEIYFSLETAPITITSNWQYLTPNNLFVGFFTNNTGSDYNSRIKNNEQNNGLIPHVGEYISGHNAFLQITCNTYNELNHFDWYIEETAFLAPQAFGGQDAANNFNGNLACGGPGTPYNKINNMRSINLQYYRPSPFDGNCIKNVSYQTYSISSDCGEEDLCDVYPDFNGEGSGGGNPGGDPPSSPSNTEGSTPYILGLIYNNQLIEASIEISKLLSSENPNENLILFLQTVKGIYEAERQYPMMTGAEEEIFLNLADNFDEAGYLSKHILNTFKGYLFNHQPLYFPQQQSDQVYRFSEKNIPSNENTEKIYMDIYPNPSNNEFTIRFNLPEGTNFAHLNIIDIEGKTIYEESFNGNIGQLNLSKSDLGSAGIYQCILTTDHEKQMIKKVLIIK